MRILVFNQFKYHEIEVDTVNDLIEWCYANNILDAVFFIEGQEDRIGKMSFNLWNMDRKFTFYCDDNFERTPKNE